MRQQYSRNHFKQGRGVTDLLFVTSPFPLRRPWGPGRVDQSLWGSLPLESQRVRMNIELSEDSVLNAWRELTCDADLRGWLGEDRERVKECQWEGDRERYHSPLGYTLLSQTPLDLSVSWASLGGVSECVLNWVLTLVVTEVLETEETTTNSGALTTFQNVPEKKKAA